jgi:FkbM family methyltransferase
MVPTSLFSKLRAEAGLTFAGTKLALSGAGFKFAEVDALRRFFRETKIDCVFDVGANKGQYATLLRKEIGFRGQIISFEPNPNLASILIEKTKRSKFWSFESQALSDRSGALIFNVMNDSHFSSFETPLVHEDSRIAEMNKVVAKVEVKTVRLDDIYEILKQRFNFQRPFLKMDTQGHDLQVIRGASQSLKDMIGIQSEMSFKSLYKDVPDYQTVIGQLEEKGFGLNALFKGSRGLFPELVEMDGIFFNRRLVR